MNGTRLMLWVVAAVVAVGVTTAAVTVANATGGRDDVLAEEEVSRQLADESGAPVPDATGTPRTPGADRSTPPASTGEGVVRTLRSRAGQVVARCHGATAFLEAWSPHPGYRVDDVVRGPAAEAYLWIESDSFADVQVLVRCQAGEPVLTDLVEPDDHGGDRDDDRDDDRDGHDDDYDDRGGSDRG